ncbi:hypothetical protein ACJMK2_029247 [Sinanodonta woodiana]|uniref:Mab-21-like HhH/H2TH-like domain-containing protein n=1 Tax=Sinanodonta woodiana TaxID=1069815 RepID=A0ABD3XB37_SINWO
MALNMPDYYKDVSVRLNRVLDTVGLGDENRWRRINMLIQSEEVVSLSTKKGFNYFGSQAEASTTPGLQSDIDMVFYEKDDIVIKDLDSWMPLNPTLLIVSDDYTLPGYVKLQSVNMHHPRPVYNIFDERLELDRHGRFFLRNDHNDIKLHNYIGRGPANTGKYGYMRADLVIGKRLHSWPDQASQWLSRNRLHDWPSHQTIDLIQGTGALLVPVGHKLSQDQNLEWRISFSFGEKMLVWLFNTTQYRCFILLKMINKCFIKPAVGDNVLSSYHCKTCIFYLIENTPTVMWQPDNLLLCVEMCLRLLYNWTESTICPNYFIPEENMFQCKVYGHVRGELLGVLSNLLRQEGRYLVGISCDNIGQELVGICQIPLMEFESQSNDVTQILATSVAVLFMDLEQALMFDLKYDLSLKTYQLDRYFPFHEPRRVIHAIFWKFHCSSIGSKLASKCLSLEIPDQHGLDVAHELLLWGSSSDVASGKLKLAAFCLVQNNLDMSKDVLSDIHKTFNYKVTKLNVYSRFTLQAILSENLSTTQLISQYFALSVYYHPSEINCIPKALIPEIICSTRSNQRSGYKQCVRVEPKFYLHFLEFLCYHRTNNWSHKKAALDNMIYVIRYECHEFNNTIMNLLAHCLAQEGRLTTAYRILCMSMKLIKENNGAKWQIGTMINASFRFLRGGQ